MLSKLALCAALLTAAAVGEPSSTVPATVAHAPVTHIVTQKSKQFMPGEITVDVGDSLSFVNDDVVTHNVFSRTEGFEFNLKLQGPGKVHAVPLTKAGIAEVRCAFHPTMKLKVIIR